MFQISNVSHATTVLKFKLVNHQKRLHIGQKESTEWLIHQRLGENLLNRIQTDSSSKCQPHREDPE